MRERKVVKFRVDMYDDTKFKIIDMKPERDLIHYVWARCVVLAGKVNLEGELYLSKNIPYTVETLAIEFNRNVEQIKLALDVFIELEIVELTEDNIYRVKNFAKHQNIKVKEKVEIKHNMVNMINKEEKSMENQLCDEKHVDSKYQICKNIKKITENQDVVDENINFENTKKEKMCSNPPKDTDINNVKNDSTKNDLQSDIPIYLENEKAKTEKKVRSKNISCTDGFDRVDKQEEVVEFFEGEDNMTLGEGDRIIMAFSV